MPRRNRRRTLIGIATLVFGASGFVASGTFTTGSQGSLGDGWVQVAGTDQTVSLSSVTTEDQSSSEGAGEDNAGSEGTTGDEVGNNDAADDQTGDGSAGGGTNGDDSADDNTGGGGSAASTSVEVLVDPSAANGVNSGGPARWGGSIFKTKYVTGTPDGYLRGIRNDEINQNATTRIGKLSDSPPGDDVVFLIANVGPEEATNRAPSVKVTMRLLPDELSSTDQIRFPYRVLDTDQNSISSGDNLATANPIELATGEIIEVVIVFDTSEGGAELEQLSDIQFFATE